MFWAGLTVTAAGTVAQFRDALSFMRSGFVIVGVAGRAIGRIAWEPPAHGLTVIGVAFVAAWVTTVITRIGSTAVIKDD